MHSLFCAAALFVSVLTLSGCAADRAVVHHPRALDDTRVGLGFFSHAAAGARRDYFHADNFTLDAPARLTALEWAGLVDGPAGAGLENVSGFVVRFIPFPENEPGEPVAERRFALGETHPSPTGRLGSGANEASAAREFTHRVALEPAVELVAGDYLLVVAAELIDPSAANWQWQDGETSDGFSASWSYARKRWEGVQDTDSAFTLIGTSTPLDD